MKLKFEGILRDEDTDQVVARIEAYSMEGFEEQLRKLEKSATEAEASNDRTAEDYDKEDLPVED